MLTEKQQNVLDVITKFIGENAKAPTIEELTLLLSQKSKRWVVQYLEALEKKWFLTRWINNWNSVLEDRQDKIVINEANISEQRYVNIGYQCNCASRA